MIDSIAGGGGLITIPLYIAIGVPEHLILGTNKTVSSTGSCVAVGRFIKNKAINWKEGIWAVVFSLAGATFGSKLSSVLSSTYMTYLLLVILPTILILNKKLDFTREDIVSPLNHRQMIFRCSLVGLTIGFYDGFFGPGTGTFLLIAFFLFLHMDAKSASATGRVVNFSSNIASFIYFATSGKVLWDLAMIAAIGSICGNFIGSGLVLTKAREVIKPIFNFVVILLLLKCIHGAFFS